MACATLGVTSSSVQGLKGERNLSIPALFWIFLLWTNYFFQHQNTLMGGRQRGHVTHTHAHTTAFTIRRRKRKRERKREKKRDPEEKEKESRVITVHIFGF